MFASKFHYPSYDSTPFVVTVTDITVGPSPFYQNNPNLPVIVVGVTNDIGESATLTFGTNNPLQLLDLHHLCKLTRSQHVEDLVGKKFGISLNEDLGGCIDTIYKADFSIHFNRHL